MKFQFSPSIFFLFLNLTFALRAESSQYQTVENFSPLSKFESVETAEDVDLVRGFPEFEQFEELYKGEESSLQTDTEKDL